MLGLCTVTRMHVITLGVVPSVEKPTILAYSSNRISSFPGRERVHFPINV